MPESVTPTLEQSAQKVAAYLADTIPQAGDFVIEHAPDVVRDIVTLDLARALIGGGMFLVGGIVMAAMLRRIFRWSAQMSERTDGASIVPSALAIAACAALFVLAGVWLNDAVGPYFAPKAHLLERIGVLK